MVNLISSKNTKLNQTWWQAPVVPGTQEVEVEESLEPRRQMLQGTKTAASLCKRARLHVKKENPKAKIPTLFLPITETPGRGNSFAAYL